MLIHCHIATINAHLIRRVRVRVATNAHLIGRKHLDYNKCISRWFPHGLITIHLPLFVPHILFLSLVTHRPRGLYSYQALYEVPTKKRYKRGRCLLRVAKRYRWRCPNFSQTYCTDLRGPGQKQREKNFAIKRKEASMKKAITHERLRSNPG